jgi:hypothetical protein
MDPAMIVDEAELGQLAALIARLSPGQQQLVAALADGFRGERPWPTFAGSARGEPEHAAYPATADAGR